MRRKAAILIPVALFLLGCWGSALAQTQAQTQARPKPAAPPPQTPAQPPAAAPAHKPSAPAQEAAPTADALGVPPFHPSMQFIESYDAGTGQRFYLFGAGASFAQIVSYYQSALKQKGELVFEDPVATHMFDIGRFQEATMAFPPSITVKDYASGGMQGYPNPKPNAEPALFKTVVQIVPMPAAAPPIKK
jgi:hypothetical protein